MASIADDVQTERRVSVGLLVGIILAPLIFVWFTLRKGHSTKSRVLAFLWLIFSFVLSFILALYANITRAENLSPWDNKVSMDVQFGGSDCKDPTPVAVTISNNSNTDILAYHWKISVKAKGHSSELVGMDGNGSSDMILKPSFQATFCQEIPQFIDTGYPLSELDFLPGSVWVDNPERPY